MNLYVPNYINQQWGNHVHGKNIEHSNSYDCVAIRSMTCHKWPFNNCEGSITSVYRVPATMAQNTSGPFFLYTENHEISPATQGGKQAVSVFY